jgi:hypothetical protein
VAAKERNQKGIMGKQKVKVKVKVKVKAKVKAEKFSTSA